MGYLMGLEVHLPQAGTTMLSKILVTVLYIYVYKIILIKVMNSHVIKKESVMQRKFYMIFMVLHLVIVDAGVS